MITKTLFKYVLLIVLCGCPLGSRTEGLPSNDTNQLRMGFYYPSISQIANRTDILVSLDFWVEELSHHFEFAVAPVQLFDDIDIMAKAFSSGAINMVVAPPFSLAIHFDRKDFGDCLLASRKNNHLDSMLLVSRIPAEKDTLTDLRGKQLLMPANDELAEAFVNILTLKTAQLPYRQFFSRVTPATKAKRMLLDLFFDKADAAIVNQASFDLMNELNPQMAKKIKIIADYPLISKNYSFVRRDYAQRERLVKNYKNVATTVRGQQLLQLYQQEEMVFCDIHDLEQFDSLYAQYRQLMHKK